MIRTTIAIAALALVGEAKSSKQRVKDVCSKHKFENTIFPDRTRFYTYAGFLEAVEEYDDVCSGTDD